MTKANDQGLEKAEKHSLRLLSIRSRTKAEIEQRLSEKGFDACVIEEAVAKLSGKGFLDDRKFASNWIEERMISSPRSRAMLREELERKGVSPEVISGVFDELGEGLDDLKTARALVAGKTPNTGTVDTKVKARIYRFLASRGFDPETAKEAIGAELGYED